MKKTILFLTLVSFIILGSCNSKGKENKAEPTVTQDTISLLKTQSEEEIIKKKLSEVDSTSAEEVHKVLEGLDSDKQAYYIQKYGQRFCNDPYQSSLIKFHDVSRDSDYVKFWNGNPPSTIIQIDEILKKESGMMSCYSHWLAFTKNLKGNIEFEITDKFVNDFNTTCYSISFFKGLKKLNENNLKFAKYKDGSIVFRGNKIYNYRIDPTKSVGKKSLTLY